MLFFFLNKTFQIFLRKESVNGDGHQFHQYQQSKQSPLILTELAKHKRMTTCDVGNPGPGLGWDRHENVVGLNQLRR